LILFCDTSALVKLYIQEDFTEAVCAAAEAAELVAVCRIAWAEIMAALARRVRESAADAGLVDEVRDRLREDWGHYAIVEVTQSLVELAGEYADSFALRGYDSVQLAAARTPHQAAGGQVPFACFDARLRKAAEVLGLRPV